MNKIVKDALILFAITLVAGVLLTVIGITVTPSTLPKTRLRHRMKRQSRKLIKKLWQMPTALKH